MPTLKPDPIFDDAMKYTRPHFSKIAQVWSSIDESWRFAIEAFLIARLFYALWSWLIFMIQPIAIQNFELSGEPILSIFSLVNNQGYVYLREVKEGILTFQSMDMGHVRDLQTGTIWNISSGSASQGPYAGSVLMPAKTSPSDIFPYFGATVYPGGLLSMWQRFDSNWYVSIAEHGYGGIPGDDHFPPLFPFLIRLLQPIVGSAFLAGLVISQIGILVSLKLLYHVFTQWGAKATGRRALLFLIMYPTFFFLFSAYSESIFLMTTLLAFQSMHKRRWAWAGFWVLCAILTRLQGAALIFPMLYLMWRDAPLLRKTAHWVGLFIAGLGGLFYLYLRSRQVTAGAVPFMEPEWHARLVLPWETYLYAVRTIVTGNGTF